MLNPKKSVNKLKNVSMIAKGIYSELSSTKFLTFFKRIFSGKVKFEANRETKMILGGSGGMLPRKIFQNLHTVMGILALFEQFVG